MALPPGRGQGALAGDKGTSRISPGSLPSPWQALLSCRCSGRLGALSMPLFLKSSVVWMGMAALVHRLWVSGGVRNYPMPMSWPDLDGVVRCWPQSWCTFTSTKGTISPHPPPKHNLRSGCLRSWAGERYQAAWERDIKAKIK